MPPFFDPAHLQQDLRHKAMPILEAIALNDNLRSLRRFERDDPLPYVSSTESSEYGEADVFVPPEDGSFPEELQAIMEDPISDDEVAFISNALHQALLPAEIYYQDAIREQKRFEDILPKGGPTPLRFRTLNFSRRKGVIVRHNVKRRWEKLGIWNPEWGFAGRQVQPRDDPDYWRWWWDSTGAENNPAYSDRYARELAIRAVRLRQNLRRGERPPPIPRSHPGPHTTAAEAEAFLISRPWFIFQLEVEEERQRVIRFDNKHMHHYLALARSQVIKRWKERGDWRDEFNERNWVTSWKWRHESPSPEPEDLAPLNQMKGNPLDVAAEMELTPSEIDELETINLPRSKQPEGFWVSKPNTYGERQFPGMRCDVAPEMEERMEKESKAEDEELRAQGWKPKLAPQIEAAMKKFGTYRPLDQSSSAETSQLQEEAAFPPSSTPGPQQRRPRSRVRRAQKLEKSPPPPLRRSARIAGMKRAAETVPSQMASNKRRKGTVAPKPVTSRETRRTTKRGGPAPPAPAKAKTETGAKRGPGRPRKTDGSNLRSAVQKKPARTSAPARTRAGSDTKRGTSDVPRQRGRPRKNK